ncbi:MAG TPA: TIM-barrel domain-containing protein [bacterium]|nr:TIM-barrel domain-containing protein [bacterium]
MKRFFLVVLIAMVMGVSSADEMGLSDPHSLTIKNQRIRIELTDRPFRLLILNGAGETLLDLVDGPSFTIVRGQKDPYFKGRAEPWTRAETVTSTQHGSDYIEWSMAAGPETTPLVKMRASLVSENSARVTCEVLGRPEVNRLALKFASREDDRYYGMGERYESAEHHGRRILVWVEEAHLGLGRLAPYAANKPYNPFPHGPTTYFPVPFFLNPRGYGFLLDDTHPSEFDFGHSDPGTLEVVNWNSRLDFMVFYGPGPLEVIEAATAYTGRITPAPPWAFGVWNAAAQGEERVKEVAEITRRERIPTSAIWSEDWAWGGDGFLSGLLAERWDWDLNRERYPDYERVAADLHRDGFRFLCYFMPYVGAKSEAFHEGAERGYLVKDREGKAYALRWIVPKVGEPDLTNPAARSWWMDRFFKPAADYGVDGWMHDFSEYTPPDAVFADGADGWAMHNAYPVLWASLGREFWERERPDGDWVFFMRAGYTGSWKYAPLMWTGDQNMDWERYDGIPSVIPAVNSVGISGSPITSTDISGYHCIPGLDQPADKELFFRWTELGALLPVMRIHESSGCAGNWLFDSDRETLLLWKKYAELHVALFPYIFTLVHDAAAHGWPVVRHLVLHYPDDPGSRAEEYEFMLGDRVLAAPVIVEKAREREVYFPPGEWVSYWHGTRYQGPGRAVVPAPLDQVPLFVKAGTLLPMYDGPIDTLVKESREDVNGWDDANRSLKAVFFGEGADEFTLWDGTRLRCEKTSSHVGACTIADSPLPRSLIFEFR